MDIEGFLTTIEGLSDNSRLAYEQTLWQLYNATKGNEPTTDEIYRFLKGYNASSLQRHKAAIRAYWDYRGMGKWPFTRRQFTERRQRIPKWVPASVIADIISLAKDEEERMFLTTLFQLGCRISELMSITPDKITGAGIMVITKGGNEYLKVTNKQFNRVLMEYVTDKKGLIFPKAYNYYLNIIKGLAGKAGHPEVTPHTFRHSRAVDLRKKGMSLDVLQQFLGHKSINTTAIYLQIDGGGIADELERIEGEG